MLFTHWGILTVKISLVLIVVDNSLNLLKAAAIYCLNNKNIFVTDLDKQKVLVLQGFWTRFRNR
jgi:phage-related holin